MMVDSVNSVIHPKGDDIVEKPEIQGSKGSDYVTNVIRQEQGLVMLLDVIKCLGETIKTKVA